MQNILKFLLEADKLKKVERQTLVHTGGRRENSAEHSWHLALSALAFQQFAPAKLDLLKVVKMALLHDLVEVDAGDIIVYQHQPDKAEKERKALERLTSMLPPALCEDFRSVWLEFEDGKSAEAKYVHAIDRFLPIYSNYLNEGHSWKNHNVSSERVIKRCEPPISAGVEGLWKVTKEMLGASISNGHLDR